MFALHIADGFLHWPWLTAGWVIAGIVVFAGARRIADRELPRVALIAAAFFVASLIHIRIGPTSVHLIFNSLAGVVLGVRAGVAVAVGLCLQALLLSHGGLGMVGVNTTVIALPAVVVGGLLRRVLRQRWFRAALRTGLPASLGLAAWLGVTLLAVELLCRWDRSSSPNWAAFWTLHPAGYGSIIAVALLLGWCLTARTASTGFLTGLLAAELTLLLTLALHSCVLAGLQIERWENLALAVWLVHLPVIAVEVLVTAFVFAYLERAAPELLHGE